MGYSFTFNRQLLLFYGSCCSGYKRARMELKESELFTGQDFEDFTNWLNLKDFSGQWGGRVQQELEKFYLLFLTELDSLDQYQLKKKIVHQTFNEPLKRWFQWFIDKHLIFICLSGKLPLYHAIKLLELDSSSFLKTIYLHFKELDIALDQELLTEEHLFKNQSITLKDLCKKEDQFFRIEESCMRHPVHSSLDFTFYPEWKKALNRLRSLNHNKAKKIEMDKDNVLMNFIYEFAIIFTSIAFALGVFKIGNKFYNNYLASKIEIYEPSFFWLDKESSFKAKEEKPSKINLEKNEMEKLEIKESKSKPFIREKRETPESEVYVLSSENIPKDFKYISEQKSRYEEIDKGGFRDKVYGRKKTYRVILNSVEMKRLKEKIKDITFRYKTKEFGKVALGQEIPGGSYFNLYVKDIELNDFLEEVVGLDTSSRLYVSKTNRAEAPKGYEKVFIWIKSI